MSTIKDQLYDILTDLTEEQLKRFKYKLCDSRQGTRIRVGEVEKADRLDLVNLLIRKNTETGAVPVTISILESIDCNDLAAELKTKDVLGSARECASRGGAATPPAAKPGRHFIDVHRIALIERVTNTNAILDRLLDWEVITQQVYSEIKAEATNENRMRKIFSGPMLSGVKAKDVLYEILESQERFLINELKELRG